MPTRAHRLTCREQLKFAVDLHQSELTQDEANSATDRLLEQFGLGSCAHVLCGTTEAVEEASFKGLSGGQRRRLSLAVALAKKPAVLIADEPTSGLDAAAACAIMQLIDALAQETRAAVMCTIHQPSASVYARIHQLLLLTKGCTAYHGPAHELSSYLDSVGRPVPSGTSVAEHALDVTNADFACDADVDAMIAAWRERAPPPLSPRTIAPAHLPELSQPGLCLQFRVLRRREHLLTLRDVMVLLVPILLMFLQVTVLGIYFFKVTHDRRQGDGVHYLMYMSLALSLPSFSVATVAVSSAITRRRVRRETSNGMYGAPMYILTTLLYSIPQALLLSLFSTLLAFAWGDFKWEGFAAAFALASAISLCFNHIARLCGFFVGEHLAAEVYQSIWMIIAWTAGLLVNRDDEPWAVRWVTYINPLQYAIASYAPEVIRDGWQGTLPCTPGSGAQPGFCPNGFYCPDRPAALCYGPTADDVLHGLHMQLQIVGVSRDHFWRHLSYILLQILVLLLFNCLILYRDSMSRVEPGAPEEAKLSPMELLQELPTATIHGVSHVRKAAEADSVTSAPAVALGSLGTNEAKMSHVQLVARGASVTVHAAAAKAAPVDGGTAAGDAAGVKSAANKGTDPASEERPKSHTILRDVNVSVGSGEVLAVMGPSGAGKTTLLSLIMGEGPGSTLETWPSGDGWDRVESGEILINGQPLAADVVRAHFAFIPQEDGSLFPFLLCIDQVRYAVACYRGELNDAEVAATTAALLAATGLTSCQRTRAGNDDYPGLSGGQRRRLSLAVALAKKPAVLIADEPTSGLDAAAACAIMQLIDALAQETRAAVMCTIHQPSASVYARIHQLLLLTKGCTAYHGPAHELSSYLDSVGRPVPSGTSVAEHALDVTNADFACDADVDAMIAAWRERAPPPPDAVVSPLSEPPVRASFARASWVLACKLGQLCLRDGTLMRYDLYINFFGCLFFVIVFLKVRDRDQMAIVYLAGLAYTVLHWVSSQFFPYIARLRVRWRLFESELKAGMYGVGCFWFVWCQFQLVVSAILAFAVMVPLILLNDDFVVWLKTLPELWTLLCLWIAYWRAVADLLCWGSRTLANWLAIMAVLFTIFSLGFFVVEEELIWPFRLFYYILPGSYFFGGFATIYMRADHRTFSGSEVATNETIAGRLALSQNRTFYCPGEPATTRCFGRTSAEILSTAQVSALPISELAGPVSHIHTTHTAAQCDLFSPGRCLIDPSCPVLFRRRRKSSPLSTPTSASGETRASCCPSYWLSDSGTS